jgi:hypothetical protein
VSVAAVTTTGGNGGTGSSSGGNAGAITLDAGGGAPTITLAGNLTALGGNQVGGATPGTGGAVRVKADALLNAATVTVDSRGGNAPTGTGANLQFDGAINSQTSGRALVLQAGHGDVAVTGGAHRVLQAIYADGMTYVSVFIEPYKDNHHGRPMHAVMGATQTLSMRQGDWWVTVIGDVPAATLQLFAGALERKK